MHENQQRILDLASSYNLARMTLREIGEKAGLGDNPQLTRHHLGQLVKNGFLTIDKKSGQMRLASDSSSDGGLISIPIMGQANCGEALSFADNRIEGYLQISSTLLKDGADDTYALRASGDSMNTARIETFGSRKAGIDDGDYVVVDRRSIVPSNNDYVVSIIDGLANIKKFKSDEYGVRLVSESTQAYPPIAINPDEQDYSVAGKVVAIVKN